MTYTVNAAAATTQLETLLKEQVADVMSNLYPLDTPLQQVLEKIPVRSTFEEFPIDSFPTTDINRVSSRFGSAGATAATTSAKPEAHTPTDAAEFYPRKIRGVIEIQNARFSVSRTDRQVSHYAIGDRFAYEAMKKTQAVVNMFEHSFWWSPGTVAGGADLDSGGGTYWARQTQGLVPWIFKSGLERSTNGTAGAIAGTGANSFLDGNGNEFGDGGGDPTALTNSMAWAYNANGATLDQAMFKQDLMAQWYRLTGRQGGAIGFTGSMGKNLISQFAHTANGPVNERTIEAAAKTVVDAVDFYETDFGIFGISLCRYLDIPGQSMSVTLSAGGPITVPYDEVLLFVKPEYYKIGVLSPVHMEVLGKTGDFESGMVVGEMGLFCKNTAAGAGVCNFVP